MSPPPGRDALAARIRAFVTAALAGHDTEPFEDLLLDAHAWQVLHAPVIAALRRPLEAWWDVPAVPVDLFKQVRVGTVPPGAGGACFRTSGTTAGTRGAHHLWSTDLYDHAALAWARRCVPGAPGEVAALLSSPAEAPDSSLSHMVAAFGHFASPPGRVTWHLPNGHLDSRSLSARVAQAPGPLFVAATAFALADWLDHGPTALPPGSVLMITGGFKGRRTALDEGTLLTAAAGLGAERVVLEYGMTELSSQLWAHAGQPYRAPPWLRVVAIDPATGARVTGPGQLRFYDLLNLDSTVGVETLDHGVVHPDGRVTLLGRLPGAAARGCSLTVEDAWDER